MIKKLHAWFSQKQFDMYLGGPIYLQGGKKVYISNVTEDYEKGKKFADNHPNGDFIYIGLVDEFVENTCPFMEMDDLDYDYEEDCDDYEEEELEYEDECDEIDEMYFADLEEEMKNYYQNKNTENFPTSDEIAKLKEQGFSFDKKEE